MTLRHGGLAILTLTAALLAGCASKTAGPVDFNAKYDCRAAMPITFIEGLPTLEARVTGTRRQPAVLRFLLNPGQPYTSLSMPSCSKIGCSGVKPATLTLGAEVPRRTPMLMEWGGKDLGNKTFHVSEPATGAVAERLQQHGLDGVLGADVLLDQEIVLNFRDGVACFPTSKLGSTARWLRLGQMLDKDRTDFLTDGFYGRPDLKFLIVGLSPAGTEGNDEPRVFIGR